MFLRRVFTYIKDYTTPFRILVADSSDPAQMEQNKNAAIEILGDVVTFRDYEHAHESIAYKFMDAVNAVNTPYLCFFADDDIMDLSSVERCVNFLEKSPDYTACHGKYINFGPHDGKYELSQVEWDGLSINHDCVCSRISHYFLRYQAIFYAVTRTKVMQRAMHMATLQKSPFYMEFAVGISIVISGKVERLNELYSFRWGQIGPYDRPFFWEQQEFIEINDDRFFEEFRHFRNDVLHLYETIHHDTVKAEYVKKTITYSFLGFVYLSVNFRELGRRTLPSTVQDEISNLLQRKPITYTNKDIWYVWNLTLNKMVSRFKLNRIAPKWLRERRLHIDLVSIQPTLARSLSKKELSYAAKLLSSIPFTAIPE